MPARQPVLDPFLALLQPVHRAVQIILIRVSHVQLISERGLVQLTLISSFEPGAITRPTIIAKHRSRSRPACGPAAAQLQPAAIANAALT